VTNMMIMTETHDNIMYYIAETSTVVYTLRFYDSAWELHSQRKALGRYNMGSYRFFKTLEQIESQLKCFVGISKIIEG